MLIPSELPRFATPVRSGALQALALQSGQVLDARVIGAAANGGVQVEIRGQVLNLILPTATKPGDTLKLLVQGTGPQMRLALQAPLPSSGPSPPTAPPQAGSPAPTAPAATGAPQPAAMAASPSAVAAPAQATSVATPAQTQQSLNPAVQAAPPHGSTPAPGVQQAGNPSAAPATPVSPVAPQQAGAGPALPASPVPATPPAQPMSAAPMVSGYAPPVTVTQLNPLAAAPAASALVPPAPGSAVPDAARPIAPATAIGTATAHTSSGNPQPPPVPQPASTPQAALSQMMQVAIPRQGPITALTTALSTIAGKVVVPEPVARAAQQVLASRLPLDGARFDGSTLQAAIRSSGIFQEASLARGQIPLQQGDIKSTLLTLRQALTSWLGQQAPVTPVARIPPPLRGAVPRARPAEMLPMDPSAAPEEVGRQLLERTEAALARIRLHQHASLPDPAGRTADWSMDLPVMVGAHQTLLQLQIHRDQHKDLRATEERGWQMRFAINLPGLGEIGAQVSLRGNAVGVMLWAAEPGTSSALEAGIGALREALAEAGLQPGAVIVRHGEPPAPATPAPSGHFVDARS